MGVKEAPQPTAAFQGERFVPPLISQHTHRNRKDTEMSMSPCKEDMQVRETFHIKRKEKFVPLQA